MNKEDNNMMNPNFPKARGCFLDKRNPGKVVLIDYPTWASKNNRITFGEVNAPIPDGRPFEKEFATIQEAYTFAKTENYVVCSDPWTKPKYDKKDHSKESEDFED